MKERIFNIIRGVLITIITIILILGYIWFVFDLNMLAWGTLLIDYASRHFSYVYSWSMVNTIKLYLLLYFEYYINILDIGFV